MGQVLRLWVDVLVTLELEGECFIDRVYKISLADFE